MYIFTFKSSQIWPRKVPPSIYEHDSPAAQSQSTLQALYLAEWWLCPESVLHNLRHFEVILSLKRCFLWSLVSLFHLINTYGSDRK